MGRLMLVWLLGVGVPATPPGLPSEGHPNDAPPNGQPSERLEFTQTAMAVPTRIVLYAPDTSTATTAAKAAFARIRQLDAILSDYDPQSELRRLCRTAGEGRAVPVGEDLWRVLAHAQALSERTSGAFDATVGPVVRLWRRARRRQQLPSPERLQAARALMGHRFVRLDSNHRTVELLKPGMRLDLGGIAKGYAVDEALATLRSHGIDRALVDAGGDIALGDSPPGKSGWRIGVARLQADGPPDRVLLLSRVAVATSGDTRQYVEIGRRRYSHIIDPRTGLGLTDHSSVTIISPEGISADSLASAVSVLGPQQGLKLIENTPGTAALIVRAPEGKVETYESNTWKQLQVAPPDCP